jgi:hypothetical protein
MRKKILLILMIIGLCIVCYIGGWWTRYKLWDESLSFDYAYQVDSLKRLNYLREDEQCLYYGKSKEEILAMNAKVVVDTGEFFVFQGKMDGNIDFRSTFIAFRHPRYFEKIMTATDTLWFYSFSMKNPFNYTNKLDILFEKTDSGWYANSCLEYNSEEVQF